MTGIVDLEKIEITKEKDGNVSLYLNGEKVKMDKVTGIHLDIRYTDNDAFLDLKTINRVAMLNFCEPLCIPRKKR